MFRQSGTEPFYRVIGTSLSRYAIRVNAAIRPLEWKGTLLYELGWDQVNFGRCVLSETKFHLKNVPGSNILSNLSLTTFCCLLACSWFSWTL